MAEKNNDLSRCAIHTMTNKPWSLRECVEHYVAAGLGGLSVWRNVITPAEGGVSPAEGATMIADAGLVVPALVRGGFFVSPDSQARQDAIDENRRCIDEAATIGAEMIVLVVGADPDVALADGRQQVAEGIASLLDQAATAGVKLAIEPLHPMYAAKRSCVNRLAEARAICDSLDHPACGVAVDVYHVWWDPDLPTEIDRLGQAGRLLAFHVCDWRLETRSLLTDREIMGRGCIDIATIRRQMHAAGFTGFEEVEIFSDTYWAMDQQEYLGLLVDALAG